MLPRDPDASDSSSSPEPEVNADLDSMLAGLALAALLRLGRGGAWVPWAAAVGLVLPIGMLAHDNGGSPWLWALWALATLATASWVRNGHEVKQD